MRRSIICGDNLEVMRRLSDEHGAVIDFIYIDPPFCSDRNYTYRSSAKTNHAFTDIWRDGLKTYLPWISERLLEMRDLLKASGVLCVHLDYRTVHYLFRLT
jgi:DNA modification methylase